MDVFKFLLPVLLVLMIQRAGAQPIYDSPTKKYCFYCPPGTKVDEHCQEDLTNSTCVSCEPHHYSDKPNSRKHCDQCKTSCPKFSQMTTDCTPRTNRKCVCDHGYHKYPIDVIDPDWKCRTHRKCQQDEGEVYYGNHTHNTECRKCQKDVEFVNKTDPNHPICQMCTPCDSGEVVQKACSVDNDTICGNNTGHTVPTQTSAATTSVAPAGGGGEEQHLSTGHIIAIAYVVLVVIAIITGVVLYKIHQHHCRAQNTRDTNDINRRWILAWIGGSFLFGVGCLAVLCVYLVLRSRRMPAEADGRTTIPLRDGAGGATANGTSADVGNGAV